MPTESLNVAELDLTSYVGQIVTAYVWRTLLAECEWRHQDNWQLFAVPVSTNGYIVTKLVCLPSKPTGKRVYPEKTFRGPQDAQQWGVEQGCFLDDTHAGQAYELLKRESVPTTASDMWRLWVQTVEDRKLAAAIPQKATMKG